MDCQVQKVLPKSDNKCEYKKVYHLLDELGFSDLKSQFSEHQISDSTLAYIESEEELKLLLKEIGLPAGPVFAFVKLWFRYKNNPDNFELDRKCVSYNDVNNHMYIRAPEVDHKHTQTDNVATLEAGTQTHPPGFYQAARPQNSDPYDMFRMFTSLPYLPPHMPVPGNIPNPLGAYNLAQWPYNPLPQSYPDHSNYNGSTPVDVSEFNELVNGLPDSNVDPLENFCPHDTDEIPSMPPEKNENEATTESESASNSTEYALFPDTEPLCSPKTSHMTNMDLVNEKDDVMISRLLQAEQERDQKSYATALKDHKEGQQSLSNILHNEAHLSPGARSRSSSTISANNISRPASSNDFLPLSPTRETHEVSAKSPPNRPYLGVDDIDPQQKASPSKSINVANFSNPTFTDYYDNLPESAEYVEATKERNVKPGWRPHGGKHEKTGKRLDFKPHYIDKEGRVRHGVRVRGALKSMECWLHTTSKPPIDCLFAHSRIGDTLEFICIKCTYEKPRNFECRDKKGHGAFVCNLGPYRDINGEKWRCKPESL